MGPLDLNWGVETHNVAPPITALGLPAIAGYIYCRDFCVGEDMVMKRRDFLMLAAAGSLLPQTIARGQGAWPQRNITIVVPFLAGGSADLVARLFAQHFQAKYQVPVVVENKSGAGGSIGAGIVAKAAPDGYTLVLGTVSTQTINPALYSKLQYDPERDFAPISPLVRFPNLLVVRNQLPVKGVHELIAYARANDGKLNYGSSGNGTSSHLCVVMFMRAIGATMTHIPFRASSDEMTAMIGGQIDLAIDSMTTIWPLAQSGEVRALGVTTADRVAAAPDLPTIGESLPGFEATGWQGLFAPAGTPPSIIETLADEVNRIFLLPDVVSSLRKVGGDPLPMRPNDFAQFVRSERVKWGEVVKSSGIRID
jgi:tripartite-type tricarboxylate transporter receptor subunit TctC